jgi:hypothetical protein
VATPEPASATKPYGTSVPARLSVTVVGTRSVSATRITMTPGPALSVTGITGFSAPTSAPWK